jgi:hypothetical protein
MNVPSELFKKPKEVPPKNVPESNAAETTVAAVISPAASPTDSPKTEDSLGQRNARKEDAIQSEQHLSTTLLPPFLDEDRELKYFDLCNCYDDKKNSGIPADYIPIKRLLVAAHSGCPICSTVEAGLTVALMESIDPKFLASWKRGRHGELRVSYMKERDWATKRKFEIYLDDGEDSVFSICLMNRFG